MAADQPELKAAFHAFAAFGSAQHCAEMDGKAFAKMCKDCKLLGRGLTPTDADLVFAKVKPKGGRKICFSSFAAALEALAAKKGCAVEEVVAAIVLAGGPVSNATAKAEAVRLHDDKSAYTGVYAHGGPSTVDQAPANLASMCDRAKPAGSGSRRSTAECRVAALPGGAARRSTGELKHA